MPTRGALKIGVISFAAGILFVLLLLGFWLRWPLYLVYEAASANPQKERTLLYHTDHAELASELRRFAADRRWNKPDKKDTRDFYYGNDPALPRAVRALGPCWVEIKDDRVDLGCGEAVFDESRSFGISVWREGLPGWGTKKLADGVWFYADNGRVPSRFGFP
jgi:hypothetical protein